MIWEAHEHYWSSGEFTVSQAHVGGTPKYTLWERQYVLNLRGHDVLHKTYATAGEAKAHAARLVGVAADICDSD